MRSPKVCRKCKKKGHYQRVCWSKAVAANELTAAAIYSPILANAFFEVVPAGLKKSINTLSISKKKAIALVDSGSTDSSIHPRLVDACFLKTQPIKEKISMATSTLTNQTISGRVNNRPVVEWIERLLLKR